MPRHHDIKVSSTVTDVFGHRFVVETAKSVWDLARFGSAKRVISQGR